MPFRWEEDPRAEAQGVVLAVDVSCHARRVGFDRPTFVSRGVWVQCIGTGRDHDQRLLDTLAAAAAATSMSKPISASDDGAAALVRLPAVSGGGGVEVIATRAERDGIAFMLWHEFARSPGSVVRVRVVAEDDTRPRA